MFDLKILLTKFRSQYSPKNPHYKAKIKFSISLMSAVTIRSEPCYYHPCMRAYQLFFSRCQTVEHSTIYREIFGARQGGWYYAEMDYFQGNLCLY